MKYTVPTPSLAQLFQTLQIACESALFSAMIPHDRRYRAEPVLQHKQDQPLPAVICHLSLYFKGIFEVIWRFINLLLSRS